MTSLQPASTPVASAAQSVPDRFQACLAFTWRPENDGQPYHVTPGDHGGPTAWGVTLLAFQGWRHAHGANRLPDADDLREAQQSELATITRCNYWNAVQADRLPRGVDLVVYEFGFGSGPATSVRRLQEVLNAMGCRLKVDGALGPATLAAVAGVSRLDLVRRLGAAHAAFYRSLNQPVFLRGWLRRNADRLTLALAA